MFRRRVAAECSKELAQRFTHSLSNPLWTVSGLQNFQRTILRIRSCADSQRPFWGLPKAIPWVRENNSADSWKTIPQTPKRWFAGSPQTIHKFPHRLSRKAATDYCGSHRISVSNLWHVRYIATYNLLHSFAILFLMSLSLSVSFSTMVAASLLVWRKIHIILVSVYLWCQDQTALCMTVHWCVLCQVHMCTSVLCTSH